MRIDARPHQAGDLHMLAADVAEHVGDRAGRANDVDRILPCKRACVTEVGVAARAAESRMQPLSTNSGASKQDATADRFRT